MELASFGNMMTRSGIAPMTIGALGSRVQVQRPPTNVSVSSSAAVLAQQGEALEYSRYTRPVEFRGMKVPDVLLSGHHGEIERWRREQTKRRTADDGS